MKKLISVLMAIILVTTSFIACSSSAKNSNKLIMATNAEFPPYEYKENNEFVGIDIEIAKYICEKAGKELEVLDIAFDSIIPSVNSGKADMGLAGMTVTEDRKQNVDFSDTYMTAVQAVILTENSPIKSIDDMRDKIIGVQTGTTGDMYCTDDYGDANIKRYNKIADGVQALKSGTIDCCVVDDEVAKNLISQNSGLKLLDTPYAEEEYAIAVKKGNTELLNMINEALNEMKGNGTLGEIKSKFIN